MAISLVGVEPPPEVGRKADVVDIPAAHIVLPAVENVDAAPALEKDPESVARHGIVEEVPFHLLQEFGDQAALGSFRPTPLPLFHGSTAPPCADSFPSPAPRRTSVPSPLPWRRTCAPRSHT